MITYSSRSFHPNVECQEEELVLIGTPGALKGSLTLDNQTGEKVFVRDLSIKSSGRSLPQATHQMQINSAMQPGEIRKHRSRLALDPKTPPGTYQFQVLVGTKERPVRVEVLPNMAIRLNPSKVQLIGIQAGKTHACEIQIENIGNLPFSIPNIRHAIGKDRDLMCRNLSKTTHGKGREGFEVWFNSLLEGISKDLGWIEIGIAEAGQVLQPGETLSAHITFSLPKDIVSGHNYEGHIRIHDRSLLYSIYPAAPVLDKPKPAKPTVDQAGSKGDSTQTKSKK